MILKISLAAHSISSTLIRDCYCFDVSVCWDSYFFRRRSISKTRRSSFDLYSTTKSRAFEYNHVYLVSKIESKEENEANIKDILG
jgi:hypothetical protein